MSRPRSTATLLLVSLLAAPAAFGETAWKLPPKEIVEILDAPGPPRVVVSPRRDAMLLVESEDYPPIELLARPIARVAGIRISTAAGCRQRTLRFRGISVQGLDGAAPRAVALPEGARIGLPVWSWDGARFAFTRDLPDGVELWIGEAATATARAVPGLRLNDVLGAPFEWEGDNRHLLVRAVPKDRGPAPEAPAVPSGPLVQETAGKASQMATFQDLLASPHDERVFEHYARTQLARLDAASAALEPIGAPLLPLSVEASPDGRFLLVSHLSRPFSYRVPYYYFARAVEVWHADGRRAATVAELPVSDEVPRQGVPTGPRGVEWRPLVPATLVWAEALDGGDPLRKAPHRDRLMTWSAPFEGAPAEALKVEHRFRGVDWTARPGVGLLTEYDRSRRWTRTHLVDLASPAAARVVVDRSVNDDYGDPGEPVTETRSDGQRVLLQDGSSIYLAGDGSSPEGDRPFLDRLDLATLKKERLFRSPADAYERFLAFAGTSRTKLLLRRESPAEPPNVHLLDLKDRKGTRRPLTSYRDPAPFLAKAERERLTYARADGVALSGTLYLPPERKPGERLPAIVWAYPLEYSDADTAGQVRGTTKQHLRLAGTSPLFFLTQGYAVLMDATMPIVGDAETVNDTYVEQLTAAAKATVAALEAKGVVDPRRVVVGGHSYGAFMTANLLAHTDGLFAAGIARSGAYNRTLTPFGFQSERRSYWEATDVYTKVSPFTWAHRIDEPILLIHGAADSNSGTFPIQSERLFEAIRGNGGRSRLVLLPHESHGYRARESVLHTLAEMVERANRFCR